MKRTTYDKPKPCRYCGNADMDKHSYDWSGYRCAECRKFNNYPILKEEEIPGYVCPENADLPKTSVMAFKCCRAYKVQNIKAWKFLLEPPDFRINPRV